MAKSLTGYVSILHGNLVDGAGGCHPHQLTFVYWNCNLELPSCYLTMILSLKILINIFLTCGANNEKCYTSNEIIALHYVGKHGWLQITKHLMENNTNVNSHNFYGLICLMDCLIFCKYLISVSTNVNFTCTDIYTWKKMHYFLFIRMWA